MTDDARVVEFPRTELGCAGHLIVSARCRWHRHTQVGNYRISSVGDYYPDRDGKRETIGAGADSFFETMVFKLTDRQSEENEGCGCRDVEDWSEIDGERYATAGEAQAGHERYVAKYGAESVSNVSRPTAMQLATWRCTAKPCGVRFVREWDHVTAPECPDCGCPADHVGDLDQAHHRMAESGSAPVVSRQGDTPRALAMVKKHDDELSLRPPEAFGQRVTNSQYQELAALCRELERDAEHWRRMTALARGRLDAIAAGPEEGDEPPKMDGRNAALEEAAYLVETTALERQPETKHLDPDDVVFEYVVAEFAKRIRALKLDSAPKVSRP